MGISVKNLNDKVTTGELAQVFNISIRTVQRLTQQGILKAEKKGGANYYVFAEAVNEYIDYLTAMIIDRE